MDVSSINISQGTKFQKLKSLMYSAMQVILEKKFMKTPKYFEEFQGTNFVLIENVTKRGIFCTVTSKFDLS